MRLLYAAMNGFTMAQLCLAQSFSSQLELSQMAKYRWPYRGGAGEVVRNTRKSRPLPRALVLVHQHDLTELN